MPTLMIIDVHRQQKSVTGAVALQKELDLYEDAMSRLIPGMESDDDATGDRAMDAYRDLKRRHDAIMDQVPEFNRQNSIEMREHRKRVAGELRQRRAERKGNPPPY